MHTTDSCAAEHEAPKGGLERWRTVGGTRQRGFWSGHRGKGECHVLGHEVSGTDVLVLIQLVVVAYFLPRIGHFVMPEVRAENPFAESNMFIEREVILRWGTFLRL